MRPRAVLRRYSSPLEERVVVEVVLAALEELLRAVERCAASRPSAAGSCRASAHERADAVVHVDALHGLLETLADARCAPQTGHAVGSNSSSPERLELRRALVGSDVHDVLRLHRRGRRGVRLPPAYWQMVRFARWRRPWHDRSTTPPLPRAQRAPIGRISTACARSRCTSSSRSTPGSRRFSRRLHRRRRLLRAVRATSSPSSCCATSRPRARSGFRRFYARRVPPAAARRVRHADRHRDRVSPRSRRRPRSLDALGGFQAAFLYVANWYFIRQSTDYFGGRRQHEPGAALLVAGGRGAVLPGVAAPADGAVPASHDAPARPAVDRRGSSSLAGCARVARRRAPRCRRRTSSRAYYGTDARAYQLLAGALLALVARRRSASKARPRAVVVVRWPPGLAALLAARDLGVRRRPIRVASRRPSPRAARRRDRDRRRRSRRAVPFHAPVVYPRPDLVRHLPVALARDPRRGASVRSRPVGAVRHRALVATSLASLSFQLLERPVRLSKALDRLSRAVITCVGLAISVVCALVSSRRFSTPTFRGPSAPHPEQVRFGAHRSRRASTGNG